MSQPDKLNAAYEIVGEMGKELTLALSRFSEARRVLGELAGLPAVQLTDSCVRVTENPTRLHFVIKGPIPTVNMELKNYLPKDRFLWATLRDWWTGQIRNALNRTRCPTLSTACIMVQVGTNMDVDNIGIKAVIDALVRNAVIPSDKPDTLLFVGLEHLGARPNEIRVVVFEPEGPFKEGMKLIHESTEMPKEDAPTVVAYDDKHSFFGPPKP